MDALYFWIAYLMYSLCPDTRLLHHYLSLWCRKRRRGCDTEGEQQLNPQAKRSGGGQEGHGLVSDVGRDVWDSEVCVP